MRFVPEHRKGDANASMPVARYHAMKSPSRLALSYSIQTIRPKLKNFLSGLLLVASIVFLASCTGRAGDFRRAPQGRGPLLIVGEFEDDYGIHYQISTDEWHQQPASRYHVVSWYPDKQYLIARNDASNPGGAGLWTRIDWMALSGMPPYEWAFCMSAYAAPSAADADRTTIARRDSPRTGCNGHPFSRMRRTSPAVVDSPTTR